MECCVPISELEKASIEFCFGKILVKTAPLAQLPSLSKGAEMLSVLVKSQELCKVVEGRRLICFENMDKAS